MNARTLIQRLREESVSDLGPSPHVVITTGQTGKNPLQMPVYLKCPHRERARDPEDDTPCPYCLYDEEEKDERMPENLSHRLKRRLLEAEEDFFGVEDTGMAIFHFPQRGAGALMPATTVHIKSALNAGKCIEGEDYLWRGPYILHIKRELLNRDMLQVLQASGADQMD